MHHAVHCKKMKPASIRTVAGAVAAAGHVLVAYAAVEAAVCWHAVHSVQNLCRGSSQFNGSLG